MSSATAVRAPNATLGNPPLASERSRASRGDGFIQLREMRHPVQMRIMGWCICGDCRHGRGPEIGME